MSRTRALYSLSAFAVVGALALAGCSSAGDGTQSSSGSSTTIALSDINAMDRSELTAGGTLRMVIQSMPTTWNWMNVNGNNVDLSTTMGLFILPQNWVYGEDGSYEPNPNYIESYEVEEATETTGQVVTVNLNPNAVWGDGTPITAADYIATWQAMNGSNSEYLVASTDGYDDMEGVEQGETEFQVIVTFEGAFPDWSAALSSVLPAAGASDPETFNDGWDEFNNDWLAGPYQVASVDQAQEIVYLERNPNWWGEEGLLDSISFRVMTTAAAGQAFANGEIDVLTNITTGDEYSQATTRADADIRRSSGLQWRHFTVNAESGVLADQTVRQAIQLGIDREAIAAADLSGIPDTDASQLVKNNHFFALGQEGYQDNASEKWSYDPEAAIALLEEAGWTLEEGAEYRTNAEGETLEFTYAMITDVVTSSTEGQLLQAQMAEIGIRVNITNVASSTFFSDTVLGGQFGITSFAWQSTTYPLNNILQLYGCEAVAPTGQNYARLCDTRIDELEAQIAVEADEETRNQLANEVDEYLWEDVMVIPLYAREDIAAVPSTLANYGAFGMSSVLPENVGYTDGGASTS